MTVGERVASSLRRLMLPAPVELEQDLHRLILEHLFAEGFTVHHEVRLGSGSRIDFVVDSCVGIEVKKGKPNSGAVAVQVERYAAESELDAIVVVVERNMFNPLRTANGKPVYYVALTSNWGVAV